MGCVPKPHLDGTREAFDQRGPTKLAYVVLAAGGAEIECTYNEHIAATIVLAFDMRSRVET